MKFIFNPDNNIFRNEKEAIFKSLDKKALKFLSWCLHLKILTKDKGLVTFDPNTWYYTQWLLLTVMFQKEKTAVILKSRQAGATTIFSALDLYYAFQHRDLQGAVISGDYKMLKKTRAIILNIYNHTRLDAKYLTLYNNNEFLRFTNGSVLNFLAPSTKRNSQGSMDRGGATNYLHATEVAFFANMEDYNAFAPTLSDEYPDRMYIYESTANGYNHFYDMWRTAKNSPFQKALFLGWWQKDTYSLKGDEYSFFGGNPQGWEIEAVNAVKETYGYEISNQQLAWWRKQLAEKTISSYGLSKMDTMLQEYPFTESDAFRFSGSKFFTSDMMKNKDAFEPIRRESVIFYQEPSDTIIKETPNGKLAIYEDYVAGARYVLGADPAYSSSPNSDNAVISIYKCYKDKLIQVAEFADCLIDMSHFTWLLLSLCGRYNAYAIIEVSGGGEAVLQFIDLYKKWITEHDTQKTTIFQYAKRLREFTYRRHDSYSFGLLRQWKTTQSTKEPLMSVLQSFVNNNTIEIKSKELFDELNWVTREGAYIGAIKGKHDDRVIGTALCAMAWNEYIRMRCKTEKEFLNIQQSVRDKLESFDPDVEFKKNILLKAFNVKRRD